MRGLDLFHSLLFEITDHSQLVSVIQDNLRTSYIPLTRYEGVFGENYQEIRRFNDPTERHRMQQDRVPCPFQGDVDLRYPPLAWTLIWKGTYSNLYGHYIPDDVRRCGFIFWDASTLECSGGSNALMRQWEQEWEDEDLRDDVL